MIDWFIYLLILHTHSSRPLWLLPLPLQMPASGRCHRWLNAVAYLGSTIRWCPPRVAHPNVLRKIYRHSASMSGARPSVANTFTLKLCSRVHQNTQLIQKIEKKIWAGSTSLLSRPHLQRQGDPRPHPPSLGAYGASTFAFGTHPSPSPKS